MLSLRDRMLLGVLLTLGLSGCAPAPRGPEGIASGDPPRVVVEGETLEGYRDGDDVAVFLGVPYAAPPIGDRRWRPPAPIEPRPGVQRATDYAPVCHQAVGADGALPWYETIARTFGQDPSNVVPPMPPISEDCLYLNVWTSHPGGPAGLPVMVWIHGGGNVVGWAYEPSTWGGPLARQGAVVVSINYRLGALGFLAHPALSRESPDGVSGNYGLLDQIAALGWVRRNIASFGGDPDRVTIFGESAGAWNVAYLMASPRAAGLFHRAISQSGGTIIDDFRTLGYEESRGVRIAKRLGVDGADDATALRNLEPGAIVEAAAEFGSDGWYGPITDGLVLPGAPARIFSEGRQHGVPLLIGATENEWTMFGIPDLDPEGLRVRLRQAFGERAERALALYPASTDEEAAAAFDRWMSDATFLCGSRFMARAMGRVASPAWLYEFRRSLPGPGGDRLGAYHGAEIPYVFGVFDPWMPWEDTDARIGEAMRGYWLGFAATGDPNGDDRPAWPRHETETDRFLAIDDEITAGTGLRREACDLWDEIVLEKMNAAR